MGYICPESCHGLQAFRDPHICTFCSVVLHLCLVGRKVDLFANQVYLVYFAAAFGILHSHMKFEGTARTLLCSSL